MTDRTLVTLVTGNAAGAREAVIAAHLSELAENTAAIETTAIILEGMPDGSDPFAALSELFPSPSITRIAPGCFCCIGNLTLRVTLNRILRHPPQKLYISLATQAHLDRIREFLMREPYDKLLALAKDLHV